MELFPVLKSQSTGPFAVSKRKAMKQDRSKKVDTYKNSRGKFIHQREMKKYKNIKIKTYENLVHG